MISKFIFIKYEIIFSVDVSGRLGQVAGRPESRRRGLDVK